LNPGSLDSLPEAPTDPEKEFDPMSAHRLALLACLALASSARAQILYTVTEIPTLPIAGATHSEAVGINNRGQVAGFTRGTQINRAFRWSPATGLLDLGSLPGGSSTSATGINDAGQVVGSAQVGTLGPSHAFRYTDGAGMVDLGTLPGHTNSLAGGINNAGQVTGSSTAPPPPGLPFRYTDGAGMQSLGLPPGATSAGGTAINSSGQVAATAKVSGVDRAFRYTDGTGWRDLGSLGGGAFAAAINDAGQVAGYASTLTASRAFLYTDGVGMRDLGALPGGVNSLAFGLNGFGHAVGDGNVAGPGTAIHALLFKDGVVTDLNSVIGPPAGWLLVSARDINDSGLIVGTGTLNGRSAGFLLTPVPEPSALALTAAGGSALYLFRRRRLR
jgi:probable HAF family extracellular repeat protein